MNEDDKHMSNQQQAISDYLEALLHNVDEEEIETAPVTEVETKIHTLALEDLVAKVPETITEVETQVEPPVIEEVVVEQQPVVQEVVETPVEASPVPDWAEHSFQCLLFKVSGLTLAVPLIKLNSVVPWTEKIVETPNQTDWYLGLVNNHGKNVKVIDTALMVLPENRRGSVFEDPSERFSHILLVNDCNWGLACDEIGDVIWLTADDVKWRKNKVQRPWLAGTAIEQMCALMDTEVFADMLNQKTAVETVS